MKAIGISVIERDQLQGTLLDPRLAGRTISLDIEKHAGHAVSVGNGRAIRKCKLPPELRRGSRRDQLGRVILSPVTKAADNVVAAVLTEDPKRVHMSALRYQNTRCEEMAKLFDSITRLRCPHSAMLVGVGAYSEDLFTVTNYLNSRLSQLKPWEIGLSANTMDRLSLNDGDHAILSRYPTTRAVAVQVRLMNDASDGVVQLPVGQIGLGGEKTSLTDLLDGDLDGDSYVIRCAKTPSAASELQDVFTRFWSDVESLPIERTTLTWLDHEEHYEDQWEIAREKILQKTAIGSLTLDWYAAFVHVSGLESAGVETGLTTEDIRQMMTDSLESVFDLKHANGSDPMALHALMLGVKTFDEVRVGLESQGLDVEKIGRLARLLRSRSVRDLAAANPAFAITHGKADADAIQQFVDSVPEDVSLAEAFRDRLFPALIA